MTWRTRPSRSWLEWWDAIIFPALRDIVMLGTGVYMLVSQAGARDPSESVIVGGIILVAPAAAKHGPDVARTAREVLSGPSAPGGGPTSSSPSPPSASSSGSAPSPPPGEGTDGGGQGG